MPGVPAPAQTTWLTDSPDLLARCFDVALLDLDGVVYVGPQAVEHAPAALGRARELGMRLAFVTNNAARPPRVVAEHLTRLGVPARDEEVITSSHAAAHYLADRLPAGAPVLVVGTTGLVEALSERGLTPVASADDKPAAVVQGYSPDLDWHQLAEGAVAIRGGVPWVATNLDPTVPSPRGPLPGNGSLVAALRHATGATPVTTGKPDPAMHRESVQRSQAQRPLVVGDRLDTDIAGAVAVGCPSLLVLTGVTTPADLIAAPDGQRPNFIGPDLRGLLRRQAAPHVDRYGAECGQWRVRSGDGVLHLARSATSDPSTSDPSTSNSSSDPSTSDPRAADPDGDGLDPLRALCAAAWAVEPAGPERSERGSWRFDAEDEAAREELHRFELTG
jgi:glycerol 3-phosphatase-2